MTAIILGHKVFCGNKFQGISGNSNNFATQQNCEAYCGSSGCPDGGEPYKDIRGQPRVCDSGVNGCPQTHYCTQVTLDTSTTPRNYCCPTKCKQKR